MIFRYPCILLYVANNELHCDLEVPMVKQEILNKHKSYAERIKIHPNALGNSLMNKSSFTLKRKAPQNLI